MPTTWVYIWCLAPFVVLSGAARESARSSSLYTLINDGVQWMEPAIDAVNAFLEVEIDGGNSVEEPPDELDTHAFGRLEKPTLGADPVLFTVGVNDESEEDRWDGEEKRKGEDIEEREETKERTDKEERVETKEWDETETGEVGDQMEHAPRTRR